MNTQNMPALFETLRDLLLADRSVRRFDATFTPDSDTLRNLVSLTTLCASARNAQPLRYRIVNTQDEKNAIFPMLKWAGYYSDWDGPDENQRPGAYLIQCLDTEIAKDCGCDDGLQLQAITLGATACGLACCIIKSFNHVSLPQALGIPETLKPLHVVAIGRPAEKVRLVELPENGDFRYFRDADDCQCVPKRSVDDIII